MTGRNFGVASVVWQVIWPILLYSFVTTVMALLVGARLDVMWILLISAILTSGVLYYFTAGGGRRKAVITVLPGGYVWILEPGPRCFLYWRHPFAFF